jgi:MraZ protein
MPYFGEYECKIDSKGRLKLPSQLIRQMQGTHAFEFVIHRGFEKCLIMYEKHIWDEVVKQIEKLNVYNKKEREFMRYFFRGATVVVMDSADRILLSSRQKDFADIQKEVILTPLNDRIEIWSPALYDAMVEREPADLSDLADELLGRMSGGENSSDL